MTREELEKLSKEELIEIVLAMQEQLLAISAKAADMEARLNMNSTNSSKPPSSDQWKRPQTQKKKSGKKAGGQAGHKGHGLKIEREADEIIEIKAPACEECCAAISEIEGMSVDKRYKIDIEIRTIITRYEQMETVCPVVSSSLCKQIIK